MTCVQGPNKLPYEVWAGRFQYAFEYLRREGGFSLTDLSLHVGKERGWADAARNYRSVVEESDLKKLEDKVAEVKKAKNGKKRTARGGLTPELTKAEQIKVCDLIDELREDNVLWWQVDLMFGYENATGSTAITIRKKDGKGCSKERYKHALREVEVYRSDRKSYLAKLVKPAKNEKPTNGTKPKEKNSTLFSWVEEIHDGLMRFADLMDEEATKVPPDFRGPYHTRRDMLKEMATEFAASERVASSEGAP